MHDLLEGVIPKELKHLFHYLVCDKKAISVYEIHCRLACFNYGKIDFKDKPSANLTLSSITNKANLTQQGSIKISTETDEGQAK